MVGYLFLFPCTGHRGIKSMGTGEHLLQQNNNQYHSSETSSTVFMEAKKGKKCLACIADHLLSLRTLFLYWDNGKEMVSWPTYKQRWRFVTEARSTQKSDSNYNQCRDYHCYTFSTQPFFLFSFIGQRTESSASVRPLPSFCFIFLLENPELMRQTKKQDNLCWICVQCVPRSIRANVLYVHSCTEQWHMCCIHCHRRIIASEE